MTEKGEGPESCTATALWMPVGAGQGVLLDLVWGVTAAILLCPCGMGVSGSHGHRRRHREGPSLVLGVDLEGPREDIRALCRPYTH